METKLKWRLRTFKGNVDDFQLHCLLKSFQKHLKFSDFIYNDQFFLCSFVNYP